MRQLLLLAAFCAAVFSNAQTTIYTQDFETADAGYTASATEGSGFTDVFNRSNPNVGGNSTFIWSVEDTNVTPATLTLDNIDVTGYSSFTFSLDLLAHHYNDWDSTDEMIVTYSLDSGAPQNLLAVQHVVGSGDASNGPAALDTDFDGDGECGPATLLPSISTGTQHGCTVSDNQFANFESALITLNNNSVLSIVITFNNLTATDEGLYLDNIEVVANSGAFNPAPVISNITATPSAPSSTDAVVINADITDADGIASATLNWGTTSGSLTNSLPINPTTGDTFEATIPAQPNGTQVFYNIVAVDSNPAPETTTTIEQSYAVLDPEPQGFGIPAVDTRYTVDFNNPVPNVNNGSFNGSGLAQLPATGQLDSNTFAFDGFSDGDIDFDEDNTTGDYARGTSMGGVSTAGIYAFDFGGGNTGLGIQPTGSEFTPGTIFFKVRNETGAPITTLNVAYEAYFLNNENRSNDLELGHGVDKANITFIPETNIESGLNQDTVEEWQRNLVTAQITGLTIAAGDTYLIAWSTNDSGSNSSDEIALDNIQIIANPTTESPRLLGNVNSITTTGGNLILNSRVEVAEFVSLLGGDITTNDNLVFTSTDGTSAVLNEVTGGTITGNVEVEQFYPAKRAFRFVSVPVDMTNTVYQDWQNGGVNTPGIGTHITGGMMSDGFDQSTSNNPSIFAFENSASQSWVAIESSNGDNTNATSLDAGTPTRILIRGDRSVSLTTANAPATDTKLITTGTIHTGLDTQTFETNLSDGEFVFVGNPYQSKVDASDVLNATLTQDINPQFMYVWNPQAGTRGAYRTYDFTATTNPVTPADPEVDGNIQPGQAVFFTVLDDGNAPFAPQVTFDESDKVGGSETNATYSTPSLDGQFNLNLYNSNDLTVALDGIVTKFSATGNDAVDQNDLKKLNNPDENIAIQAGNESLILGSYSMPQEGTVIPLQVYGFSTGDYTFSMNYSSLSSVNMYLKDNFTGINHLINNGGLTDVVINFDDTNSANIAVDRFELIFSNTTLGLNDAAFAKALSVYPNPVKDGLITVTGIDSNTVQNVKLMTLLGQIVQEPNYRFIENGKLSITLNENLTTGVYLLSIDNQSVRLIIE